MTVIKVKYCKCGHPISWHDKETGRCTYGNDDRRCGQCVVAVDAKVPS